MPVSPYLIYKIPRDILRIADACKPWDGTYDSQGYPRYKTGGQSRYVHRAQYEYFHGPLKPGERVYRVCGDRRCVNALHLVTEKPAPKRKRPRPGTAKLTARKVRAIRAAWAGPERPTQQALARKFGVSRSAISLVVRGLTWTSVPHPTPQSIATVTSVAAARSTLADKMIRSSGMA